MDQFDEKALIEQTRHDPKAFGPIYDRYVDRIYGFLFRRTGNQQLAEDLTAATFESALRNIGRFEWRGLGFAAWLYRISRNKLISHYRRQRLTTSLSAIVADGIEPTSQSDFAEQFETNDWLITAYYQLNDRDREVITLRFLEDLSSDEVAEILNCSKPNLYVRLHRALDRLEKKLKMDNERQEAVDE